MAKQRRKAKRKVKPRRTRRTRRAAHAADTPAPRAIEAALAGIAHDVRTPLTGIVALAELLASSSLGPREREWANAIKSGADHLAALTSLIVDAAKAEAAGLTLRHEPFSPRALAQAVGEVLAARAGNKELKAETTIAEDLPAMVAGDAMRLRAALENLDRQRREVHRRRHRPFRRRRRAGRARPRAPHFHGDRQRHRHERARAQDAVSPVRAGERRDRAALWRRRPRPRLRQAHRQGHGRRSRGDQQERRRLHVPLQRAGRSPRCATSRPSRAARAARLRAR